MNGPLRTEDVTRQVQVDDKMHQVRDLLIGDYVRANESRLAALETRIAELETTLTRQVGIVQQQIEKLGGDSTAERRTAFEELARSVAELGEKIRIIAR